ncbi:hypothetical protein E0Z10_g726 [Xylaria hypoxylon]|uniref:Uncharacterized protein n=1 Tax=Xylaria hypoxylon TaxID=37992 RepID=A0A4Z0YVP6_9PEZI|nr:hypothetical protein E0Z10_g726 [Xylaria hypoxylon]
MEVTAKSIENLAEQILPKQPYYLSLSPTRKYVIHAGEKRLDEQDTRPLQYTTLVGGEADRGVLITRAYFTVRDEPNSSNAPTPTTLKVDPKKPRKTVTLKDYKNKKVEGDSPPKSEGKEKPNDLSTIKEREGIKKRTEPAPKEMDSRRDFKKSIIANVKVEAPYQYSPSPERRKRVAETDEGTKPVKRVKVEDATPNGATPRPFKDTTSHKPVRSIPPGKSEARDMKPSPVTNGRPASSSSTLRATSPKHTSHVNGHGKTSGQTMHKRAVSNGEPVSKAVPRLLSPLHIADLSVDKSSDMVKESTSESRRSPPKKRPIEAGGLKSQSKKIRDDREPSPSAKKRKVLPPLLSPTLPPIVMDELARLEKNTDTPSKEASLRNSQASDSSVIVKKPPKPTREETIHVDNMKEPTQYVVTIKYKKRHAKTIERLLNLPSGGKKKTESLKREDRTLRESSGSVEPGTARKRPRTTTDISEALKQPKAPDILRPSTPPRQSTAMSRIASNGSQVDTPGAANSLTPSIQPPPGKRREPILPEKLERAHRYRMRHEFFMELGTKLKHERDAIMMHGPQPVPDRDLPIAMSSGIQALLAWMHAAKLQSDAYDLERLHRQIQPWKQILPFFNIYKAECHKNSQVAALLSRIQAIFMIYMCRTQWFLPSDPESAQRLVNLNKDEAEAWRLADHARKKLGIYDGGLDASDGGAVGKLLDRIGPWTTLEEAIPIALDVLRNALGTDKPWKPNSELAKLSRSIANGVAGQ